MTTQERIRELEARIVELEEDLDRVHAERNEARRAHLELSVSFANALVAAGGNMVARREQFSGG